MASTMSSSVRFTSGTSASAGAFGGRAARSFMSSPWSRFQASLVRIGRAGGRAQAPFPRDEKRRLPATVPGARGELCDAIHNSDVANESFIAIRPDFIDDAMFQMQ
jgi:hypothetical protein